MVDIFFFYFRRSNDIANPSRDDKLERVAAYLVGAYSSALEIRSKYGLRIGLISRWNFDRICPGLLPYV